MMMTTIFYRAVVRRVVDCGGVRERDDDGDWMVVGWLGVEEGHLDKPSPSFAYTISTRSRRPLLRTAHLVPPMVRTT